jgi:tetratricopeptide (TPR) repeat protein
MLSQRKRPAPRRLEAQEPAKIAASAKLPAPAKLAPLAPLARIAEPAKIPASTRFIAIADGDAFAPDLLARMGEAKAVAVREATPARRPYQKEDLFAVAEIAYHYLFAGAVPIASVLYEGVAAICPNEPSFWLGLGLCADRLGDKQKAHANYARACALDPADPRADINIAELYLEENDVQRARAHLARAVKKADAKNDRVLAAKARAILGLVT